MSELSKNLKLLLSKTNLSEYKLSKETGIPQQMINKITLGINQNPKLATIMPIANYFKIPLQELITGKNATGKIPLIKFNEFTQEGIEHAIAQASEFISIDLSEEKQYFATVMYDDSMDPKFPIGTVLIFEKNKTPTSGDFCLLKTACGKYIFRQIFINHSKKIFMKCLNPTHKDYEISLLPVNVYVLATLLEARMHYSNQAFSGLDS